MNEQENSQGQERVEPEQTSAAGGTAPSLEPKQSVQEGKAKGEVSLANKYRLKIAFLFSDFWVAIIFGYFYSCKPINAKNHPVYSALFNGIGHGSLAFIYGFIGMGGNLSNAMIKSVDA